MHTRLFHIFISLQKRVIFPSLFFLAVLPAWAQEQQGEGVDSVYTFRFVPQKDMFFVPYGNNRAELERLSAFVGQHRKAITDGKMPVHVDGYCNSLSGEAENLAVARLRSNRVKTELILHEQLEEECFVTRNHAGKGDWVTVRIYVAASPEMIMEQTGAGDAQAVFSDTLSSDSKSDESYTTVPAFVPSDLQSDVPGYQDLQSALSLRFNLLRWATLTPDLGLEWRINRHFGVLVNGSWTSWSWSGKDRRYALWKVSPEVRYYLGSEKRGFLGAMYHLGEFNYKLGDTGRQGDYQGGGITGGYRLELNRALSLDFHAALGYTYADYDKYKVIDGVRVRGGSADKNYWGINQLGITLVWKLVK